MRYFVLRGRFRKRLQVMNHVSDLFRFQIGRRWHRRARHPKECSSIELVNVSSTFENPSGIVAWADRHAVVIALVLHAVTPAGFSVTACATLLQVQLPASCDRCVPIM